MMQKRRYGLVIVLLIAICVLAGCATKKPALTDGREVYVKEEPKENEENPEETEESEQREKLYLVMGIDTSRMKITLKGYKEETEKEYSYTLATGIKDKYGNDSFMEKLSAGEMVNAKIQQDKVISIQVSDEVFTYADVYNFQLDTEKQSVTIGKSVYYYEDDVQVFYNNNEISMREISKWDTICLKGIDKKIYAIQVTSGHGTIVLQNTGVFEGGNITIGNMMSMEITPAMRIEAPEGTHLLSVANDGYGGSREVTVEANREVTIDLEELKGEGPKTGLITFTLTPENAVLYLNGEVVDVSKPQQLRYGRYRLKAEAEGYEDWNRILIVNSESANVKVELKATEEAEAEEKEDKKDEEDKEDKEDKEKTSTGLPDGRETEKLAKELIQKLREDAVTDTKNSTKND